MPARRSTEPAGRREQRLEERRRRQAELRQQKDAEQRRGKLLRVGAVILGIAIVAGVAGWFVTHQAPAIGRNVGGGAAGQHVAEGTPITYTSYPPTSGQHYPAPAQRTASETPLPEGRFVHNLEHGVIAILYKCPTDPAACSTLKQQMQDLYKLLPPDRQFHEVKAVVSPYDRMDHQIAVLAWGWIDELDRFDGDEITRFYQAHVGHGPEAVA